MKSLLIETNLFEGKVNEDEGGRTLVKGVLQRASAENQNGRVYPREILMREAKKYEILIKERRALGELDHPDSTVINLKNVSHNVREIHWEGDDLCGTVEILPTPSGNILKELVKEVMVEENEYQAFFAKALEKSGKSIPSMSDEEKKAFFNKIDTAWNGKGEKKNEGNAFGAAVTKAKEEGDDEFQVGGEKFKVA